jgi:hypothetical protein
VNIETSKYCVDWLPIAGEAIEPDIVAYQSARRDTEKIVEELLARGYNRTEILRGVRATVARFGEEPQS